MLSAFSVTLGMGCSRSVSGSQAEALQVTAFGVLAKPGSEELDSRLADVAPTLRKLLPNYGFQRVGLKSTRLSAGQEFVCPLGGGRSVKTELLDTAIAGGKVRLKFTLLIPGQPLFIDVLSTPPNQLVLVDRMLPSKERLLVGLAAR